MVLAFAGRFRWAAGGCGGWFHAGELIEFGIPAGIVFPAAVVAGGVGAEGAHSLDDDLTMRALVGELAADAAVEQIDLEFSNGV